MTMLRLHLEFFYSFKASAVWDCIFISGKSLLGWSCFSLHWSLPRASDGAQCSLAIVAPPLLPKSLFPSGISQVSLWIKANITHHWISATDCSTTMLSRNQRSQRDSTITATTKNDSQKFIFQVFYFTKIIIKEKVTFCQPRYTVCCLTQRSIRSQEGKCKD